jgi:hypothetical protein
VGGGRRSWKGVNPGFKNFPKQVRETVDKITAAIDARYSVFSAELKLLVEQKKAEPVYIPGNHDYMLQLSPEARKTVRRFLSLPETPNRSRRTTTRDPQLFMPYMAINTTL